MGVPRVKRRRISPIAGRSKRNKKRTPASKQNRPTRCYRPNGRPAMQGAATLHTPRRVPRLLRDQFKQWCKGEGFNMSDCLRACMAYWADINFEADKWVHIQTASGLGRDPVLFNMPRKVHKATKLAFAKWCAGRGYDMGACIMAIMRWCIAAKPDLDFEVEKWGKA